MHLGACVCMCMYVRVYVYMDMYVYTYNIHQCEYFNLGEDCKQYLADSKHAN